MRILLDTHIVIWTLLDDPRLSLDARLLLRAHSGDVHYSVASLWEIGIKHGLGRLELSPGEVAKAMKASRFARLEITEEHINRLVSLPHHHRDPFDRMLIAQAEAEPLRLVTSDRQLAAYGSIVVTV